MGGRAGATTTRGRRGQDSDGQAEWLSRRPRGGGLHHTRTGPGAEKRGKPPDGCPRSQSTSLLSERPGGEGETSSNQPATDRVAEQLAVVSRAAPKPRNVEPPPSDWRAGEATLHQPVKLSAQAGSPKTRQKAHFGSCLRRSNDARQSAGNAAEEQASNQGANHFHPAPQN